MPSTALSTSASTSNARVDVSAGGSSARNAEDATSSAIAVVKASCDTEGAAWNNATGSSPTAQNAHFERGVRAMATATIARYTARTVNRPMSSNPSVPSPSWRPTKIAADCGRYGTGEPNVEKVTKPWLGSVGHGWTSDTRIAIGDEAPPGASTCGAYTDESRSCSRTTSRGTHAPLKPCLPNFSGSRVPFEI